MNMSEDDPRRMEEIRKYAAIYGRFDCKRKPEKPLTLHEVSDGKERNGLRALLSGRKESRLDRGDRGWKEVSEGRRRIGKGLRDGRKERDRGK